MCSLSDSGTRLGEQHGRERVYSGQSQKWIDSLFAQVQRVTWILEAKLKLRSVPATTHCKLSRGTLPRSNSKEGEGF